MTPKDAAIILIPTATAGVGLLVGWLLASARTRGKLEVRFRELERRALTAEAAAAALGKKLESLKSDMADAVRDHVDNSLYRFFADVKTRLGKDSDLASIRQIVERGFRSVAQLVEGQKAPREPGTSAAGSKKPLARTEPAAPTNPMKPASQPSHLDTPVYGPKGPAPAKPASGDERDTVVGGDRRGGAITKTDVNPIQPVD